MFPMRVPRSFVARMRRGDPTDPLLRQVLPVAEELEHTAGRSSDPLQEADARRAPGLLHKYRGRALLIATGTCAMHCRYCFRREFPYEDQQSDTGRWHDALAALAADPSIEELILSGGDQELFVSVTVAPVTEDPATGDARPDAGYAAAG